MRISRNEIYVILFILIFAGLIMLRNKKSTDSLKSAPATVANFEDRPDASSKLPTLAGTNTNPVTPAPKNSLPANPTPHPATKIESVLPMTEACKGSTEPLKYIDISAEDILAMHRSATRFEFKINPQTQCLKSGQSITLTAQDPQNPDMRAYRGSAIVIDVLSSGKIRTQLRDAWLGTENFLVPSCEKFCDHIIDKIPELIDGKKPTLIDTRNVYGPEDPKFPDAIPYLIDFKNKHTRERLQSIPQIKGTDFVVLTNGPHWARRAILTMMGDLKAEGAKSVSWLYGGVQILSGASFRPPPIMGVKIVHALQLRQLLDSGVKMVFVGDENADRKFLIPGTIFIGFTKFGYFTSLPVTPAVEADSEKPQHFTMTEMPTDLNGRYLVHGYDGLNWRPYFFAKLLLSMGYKNILMMQTGLDEVFEAQSLNLIGEDLKPLQSANNLGKAAGSLPTQPATKVPASPSSGPSAK